MSSCFVAMPFHEPIDSYHRKVFQPAIEDAGLLATRGDSLFQAGDIVQQVVKLIAEAEVTIAEISQLNANVYYEVGIAHALGKPTVLVSQSAATVPFDLRGGRVIVYSIEDPFWGDSLRTSVTKALVETLKDPAGALPPGLTRAIANSGVERTGPVEDEASRLDTIESRLVQLQRALNRSRPVEPGMSPEVLARADAARDTIAFLLDQGMDPTSIVRELVSSGLSELWSETAVRDEMKRRG